MFWSGHRFLLASKCADNRSETDATVYGFRHFERLVDPCGNWTVWDGQGDIPATYQGQVLSGLTANEARKLTALLNIMHDMERAEAADDGHASSGGGTA